MTNHIFETNINRLKVESQIMLQQTFIQKLIKDGGKPFFVGGFVRDVLLNKSPKDVDIIVEGMDITDIQESLSMLGKVNLVGESFAVIKFKPDGKEFDFDIAAPRTETKVGFGHKGFAVVSNRDITIEQDLGRRDFTINSIAVDIQTGEIFDPFCGIEDLAAREIKMTNPDAFIDDPLRILRAVQFASRFGFKIADNTFWLMKRNIGLVKEIAGERIHEELVKAFEKGGSPKAVFEMLFDIGFHDTFNLKVNRFMHIDDANIKTLGDFFSMILGHQETAPETFTTLFKGDVKIKKQMLALQLQFARLREVTGKLGKLGSDLLPLIAADMVKITTDVFQMGKVNTTIQEIFRDMQLGKLPTFVSDLKVNGNDAMEMGLKGKQIGDTLKKLFELVLTEKLPNERTVLLQKMALLVSDVTVQSTKQVIKMQEDELLKLDKQLEFVDKEIANMQRIRKDLANLHKFTSKELAKLNQNLAVLLTK